MLLTILSCILVLAPSLFIIFEALNISNAAIVLGVAALPLGTIILSIFSYIKGSTVIAVVKADLQ
ncbi:MAG: hypothetical protein GX214_07940 [Clostridiales bacterium]|nr:hypothetical protein [Clostridiales bacterium]